MSSLKIKAKQLAYPFTGNTPKHHENPENVETKAVAKIVNLSGLYSYRHFERLPVDTLISNEGHFALA